MDKNIFNVQLNFNTVIRIYCTTILYDLLGKERTLDSMCCANVFIILRQHRNQNFHGGRIAYKNREEANLTHDNNNDLF